MFAAGQHKLFSAVFETGFIQYIDHITSEAGNPFIEPEAHDIFDFFHYPWIVPVEIRLLFCEQMQIVFAAFLIIFPAILAKKAGPVVWKLSVRAGPPDIVIAVRA
jgi:hypothetical protein